MSTLASVFGYGLLSARAAASVAGRFYYATDTQLMYRDNGSTWDTLGLAGAGTGTVTTVKDEGVNLSTAVASLDFVGAGVTATGTTAVTVTIPAGGLTHSTLGTTSVGGSFDTRGMKIKKITLASDGLLSSIWGHFKGNASNPNDIVAVMYSDTSGSPINLLYASGPFYTGTPTIMKTVLMNTTARWLRFPVGAWLTAGDYWIGFLFDDGPGTATSLAYSSGTGADRTVSGGTVTAPTDSSIQAISTGTNDYSIYADILR